jgi:hypothetical protein
MYIYIEEHNDKFVRSLQPRHLDNSGVNMMHVMGGYLPIQSGALDMRHLHAKQRRLTINVPLIRKVREIIFFAGKIHNGTVRGGRDLFDP